MIEYFLQMYKKGFLPPSISDEINKNAQK